MNFTPIGTILSSRLNDLIIYAQFLSAFAGAKIQLVYTARASTSLLVSAVFLKIPLQFAYFS